MEKIEKIKVKLNLAGLETLALLNLRKQHSLIDFEIPKIEKLFIEEEKEKEEEKEEDKEKDKEKDKIEEFHKLPKYKQGSPEWHSQRYNYLTASTIATALGQNGKAARKGLLLNKASYGRIGGFTGNRATLHGNKMEPVANAIYSKRNNDVIIHEFGMITNEKYPILGVSPDGILEDRMLEIKCPYSRTIDGKIKNDYRHQMQEQMAVCEYDFCDFLECKFDVIDEVEFWNNFLEYKNEKGSIMQYVSDDGEIKYLYSPMNQTSEELHKWINDTIKDNLTLSISFWALSVYKCQKVYRDPQWIIQNYPILEKFWKEVEELREKGIPEEMITPVESSTEEIEDVPQPTTTTKKKLPYLL